MTCWVEIKRTYDQGPMRSGAKRGEEVEITFICGSIGMEFNPLRLPKRKRKTKRKKVQP